MTAIAGFVAPRALDALASHCSTILDGLGPYGRHPPNVVHAQGAAFGVALFDLLPEDSGGRQPLVSNDRFMLVADVRLDNREAVAARAGIAEPLSQLSDAAILLQAWTREGDRCLDGLVGDFALAVFDKRDRTLALARDATGQRPLFYARSNDALAFASMASGLLNHPTFNRGLDLQHAACVSNMVWLNEPDTYFAGISRVLPGEVVTFSGAGERRRFHWDPLAVEPAAMSFDDAVDRYGQILTSTVRSRLRRRSGLAAVHLSSGYDSSSIAATAATVAPGEDILAYTAAPSPGFAGPVPPGRSADESPLAAVTAVRYRLNHRVVHSTQFTLDYLRRQARLYQEPLRNIVNALWADEIRNLAAADGATVLLNGMGGNMTLNAGGPSYLSEWLRQRGPGPWWREARAAARRGDVRWRGILFNSVAPLLPARIWRDVLRTFRPQRTRPELFVRKEWSLKAIELGDRGYGQPNRSTAADRVEFMRAMDPGRIHKGALADSGVWELEPLADRRAVEFSIALTPEQLIRGGEYRPVARAALRNLLPPKVLDASRRGVQSADWHDHFTQRQASEILEEIATSESARSFLDLPAMRSAIANWPRNDNPAVDDDTYPSRLPKVLTLGVFLKETEEGWKQSRPPRTASIKRSG